MRIVEAFSQSGIYPLNLNKNLNNKPIFPTEIKEFAFSNYNQGSRLRISGQILTSEKFIDQLTNKDKRIKNAKKRESQKHIPPSHLFKKLFADMRNPFHHIPANLHQKDDIHLISVNSSIEDFHKKKINEDNNNNNLVYENLERNETPIEENNRLLNEYNPFHGNIELTRNSTSNGITVQSQLIRLEGNSTNIHLNYDNSPLIEPTTRNSQNTLDEEVLTPMSPGRTSISGEKTYISRNQTPNNVNGALNQIPNNVNMAPNNSPINLNSSTNQITNQTVENVNRTPNRTPNKALTI
ncbi:hypothetical protein M0812_00791 [Anaeramoeba flamelloides]|uniref:Uncharacterized protein n=1 Tax=Anaeramoeba flamelloides TaxID=1746091 RepID=A0AAV8A659_9EUKA|nr:hypothetical protein M0812_00791 [Anaeramoeba flamelloides]